MSVSSVPWIPAPSKIAIQRALIGFDGPGRDRLAGEVPGPGGFRHVPGRVFFLFLDLVEAFRRFQPFLADRDGVGLGQLQVLPEAQGEVARGRGSGRTGTRPATSRLVTSGLVSWTRATDRARRAGVERPRRSARSVRRLSRSLRPACRRRLRARRRSGSTEAFFGFAVDFVGDVADEAVDRRLGVGRARPRSDLRPRRR